MEFSAYLPIIFQAFGGVIAGNVVGGLTRGGGGAFGRSLAGLIGGLAAGQGLPLAPQAAPVLDMAYALADGALGQHLGDLSVGAAGGGVLGLLAGLLLRGRG